MWPNPKKMSNLQIIQELQAPGRAPAGLTYDGQHLWLADYGAGQIFALEPLTGRIISTFYCPGVLSGLAWDGQALWQAIMDQDWLRCINPVSHDFDRTIVLADPGRVSGLAWDGHLLWAVSQQQGLLLGVERDSGKVSQKRPGVVAAGGLAWWQGDFWLATPQNMAYNAQTGQFEWLNAPAQFALLQLDGNTGREKGRYPLDFMAMGLAWVADELWLSCPGRSRLYRARLA